MTNNNHIDEKHVEQLRNQIAELRTTIQGVNETIDQYENKVAKSYRFTQGISNESFDSSTDKQQESNPQVMQSLQDFNALENMNELLNEMKTNLMDHSQVLEDASVMNLDSDHLSS